MPDKSAGVLTRMKPAVMVVVGFLVGLVLASLDHILPPASYQSGPTKWLVVFVDWVAPPMAGVLVAAALVYAQRASRLHAAERAAAEVLAERLAGTERRQAIWVVAAAVAHDLKNPLHNLQLLVEEMREEKDPDTRGALINRLHENVSRATERIGELSRAGQRQSEQQDEKVDLSITLDAVRERLKPIAQAARSTLEVECARGLSVRGDAHAVRSAVENVAANALEALQDHHGGKLALKAQSHDGLVEVLVQDDGPGISEEVKNRLFAPFSSGHNGTGLGLAIARALTRAAGGELICAESRPGRTTFRFTFPGA